MIKHWSFLKPLKKISIVLWLTVFLWMLFIFFLSSQPALVSNSLSKKITTVYINITKQANRAGEINGKIREYAHAIVYIVLAILVVNALRSRGVNLFISYVIAFLITVTFACSDEIHQMFVPGRGAQIRDFLMDCAGVFLGLAMYNICAVLYRKSFSFRKQHH